jgi:methionyl-tRNA formyltransferase
MNKDIHLLVSGDLGYRVLCNIHTYMKITFIGTDIKSIKIIEFAKSKKIPLFIGNPRNKKLSNIIKSNSKNLLLSINYIFLIEEDLIIKFKYAINFHGSLLPKYRGRTPHVWAIINGENEAGITAHFINKGCDEGDIIYQKRVSINKKDTGNDILQKYIKLYPSIVKKVIKLCLSSKLIGIKQNESIATFFPKREPKDGKINWNWSRERIKNWVRAQSYPYPGAFTFYDKIQIIIDKVSFSKLNFNLDTKNGTILKTKPFLIVKTKNGSIKVEKIRNNYYDLDHGKILK